MAKDYHFYVYILTTYNHKVMYIGVTNSLERRVYEHCNDIFKGFTQKYHVHKLVYYECFKDIRNAIAREKQLKGWTRAKKNALVETKNPEWKEIDLHDPDCFFHWEPIW